MSSLTLIEKRYFEDLFDMPTGYVLDFSNASFAEFFRNTAKINIDDDRYRFNGDSKAKRTRTFWAIENDEVVAKVLSGMLDIWEYENIGSEDTKAIQKNQTCRKVIDRLLGIQSKSNNEMTADEFLKRDFGDISAENLKVDEHLLPIQLLTCAINLPHRVDQNRSQPLLDNLLQLFVECFLSY